MYISPIFFDDIFFPISKVYPTTSTKKKNDSPSPYNISRSSQQRNDLLIKRSELLFIENRNSVWRSRNKYPEPYGSNNPCASEYDHFPHPLP